MQPTDSATFFLPGLVHQFGNILLTVQGHVLHVAPDGIAPMKQAVLSAVERGSESLQVVRILLGDNSGSAGFARELLAQLVELGRVPSRERGVSLTLRADDEEAGFWVAAEPFVNVCAEAIFRWIGTVPAGSTGAAVVDAAADGRGAFVVTLSFELEPGSLPFPLPVEEVRHALDPLLDGAACEIRTRCDGERLTIAFGSISPAAGAQP